MKMIQMDMYEINSASSSSPSCSCDSSIGYPSSSDSVSSNIVEEQHHHDHDDDEDVVSSCLTNDNMFEFSDLMSQLPIKRGLSKYYNGKSDSFKNLITLKSLEDVPKIISHRIKKKKNIKQDNNKYSFTTPKSKISKINIKKKKKNGSMKGSILMNKWNVTSTTNRVIHV